jgi:hypothetical protein
MIAELSRAPAGAGRPWSPAPLTAADERVVAQVDTYLPRGLALKRWWEREGQAGRHLERFPLAFTYNRPDVSYGFFGRAPVDGKEIPVLGNFQTMFYDQPKSPSADRQAAARFLNAEIRQFVLRYFMRVSDFRDPQPYTVGTPTPPRLLRPLSWCTGRDIQKIGFGFTQLYYKRADTGEVGKFPAEMANAIVDLREIGPVYEWIVLNVRIFDFAFVFRPFGNAAPFLTLPLPESSHLIVSRNFVTDEPGGHGAGELGHFGFGYAFIKEEAPSPLAWGPGRFDAAMQTIGWRVLSDGRIRVDMTFIANRPNGVANIPLNPLHLGCDFLDVLSRGASAALTAPLRAFAAQTPLGGMTFDPVYAFITLANLMTAGLASRELCISREQIEKLLILLHFNKHYQAVAGSIQTWRQIRNWLDEASLPRWVVTGEST